MTQPTKYDQLTALIECNNDLRRELDAANAQNHRVAAGDVEFKFQAGRQLRWILLLAGFYDTTAKRHW